MLHSPITLRSHHYLSDGEYQAHLLAEYSTRTIDIREQYALLPWTELQEVAAKVGIRYPIYPTTTTPIVMTTDLVLTVRQEDGREVVAVAVKPEQQLQDPRTLEKLWLERYYWNKRGIRWLLFSEIPLRAKNLLFFEGALRRRDYISNLPVTSQILARTFEEHWSFERTFNEVLFPAASAHGLSEADATLLLGAAVWKRESRIDLDAAPIRHYAPVALRSAQL